MPMSQNLVSALSASLPDHPQSIDDVTAVIVTFNSSQALHASLPALSALPHVIIVDNASKDSSCRTAATLLPQAIIIENKQNIGFGRANNIALDRVTTPYALILNPDCTITPDNLERLRAAALTYPRAAILAPKLFTEAGKFAKNNQSFPTKVLKRGRNIEPTGDICVDWVVGAAMLFNMSVMRQIGFFDEWFFLFAEEVDLCLRTRQHHRAVIMISSATAVHGEGRSTDSRRQRGLTFYRRYYRTVSDLYLILKHEGKHSLYRTMFQMFVTNSVKLPFYVITLNIYRMTLCAARLWALANVIHESQGDHCSTLRSR